ncbi:MAG: cyclic lactone autoinducer peptide [Firmicutes bacterium]|nr:cyclic lactone autoinducer peptide [Bacillota bacterium]
MKKIKYLLLTGLVTVLSILATVSAASACGFIHYQPKLPTSLQKY